MDGILIINKQKNITSQGVVSKVKKILNEKKVGHAGTLDPNATGVLPILVGKGTKISKYLIEHDKEYRAVIKLGKKTSTGDSEGDVIQEKDFNINSFSNKEIQNILNKFVGKSFQTPPMYSAIKVNGKKLYEYAREGIQVERKSREVEIYKINLINIDYSNSEITYTVECSKGTYIRTLCEDIAEALNTVGYMKELTRTKVDNFSIQDAITLEDLEKIKESKTLLDKNILKLEDIFLNKEKIILNLKKKTLFLNGVKLNVEKADGLFRIYDEEENFIGLGIVEQNLLKRDVV